MTRANPLQQAFNAGEFSPRMAARVSLQQYDAAAAQMQDLLILPQGGFTRAPGRRFVAEVKDSSKTTVLQRFQFSTEQSYALEFGDRYVRFFRNQGQLAAENIGAAITNGTFDAGITGWTDQSNGTGALSYDSTNDRLNLDAAGSGNEAIAEQQVTTTTTGVEHILRFDSFGLAGDEITVRVGSTSGASDYLVDTVRAAGYHTIAFTPSASPFFIQFENGLSRTVSLDNISLIDNAAVEVSSPYDASASAAVLYDMKMAQSADTLYIAHPDYPPHKLLRFGATSWSLVPVFFQDGPFLTENTTTTTLTTGGTVAVGATTSLTASATAGINGGQGWLTTDIGRLVRWFDGTDMNWGRIVARSSSTVVTIEVLDHTIHGTSATTRWLLGLWSDTTGYPGAVGFFEERLYFAGSDTTPQRFDGSIVADFETFTPTDDDGTTVLDDNAVSFTIASEQVNRIRWLSPASRLIIGTVGGEFTATSSGAAITPSDIDVKQQTGNGCANVQPVRVDNTLVFLQRAGRKLRKFEFDFNVDGFTALDLTLLADHITESGVIQMAFQQEPDSHIWNVRADGTIAVVVYNPGQQVVGWSRIKPEGTSAAFESVCTIPGQDAAGQVFPSDDRDEVWVIVKRTINGGTKRYVELVERAYVGPRQEDYATVSAWRAAVQADQGDAFYVGSGLTYDGAATTTITGLDHLEGETVDVWADGAVHPQRTVASGSITLEREVEKAQVGLPIRWKYKSLKLNHGASAPGATALVKHKAIAALGLVLLDTADGAIKLGTTLDNLVSVEFREVADAMDTAVPLLTGELRRVVASGWDTDRRIYMQGDGPGPVTVLALAPEMTTNDFA